MTDKQFRFARTSQCYCLGQRENACSKANCTLLNSNPTNSHFFRNRLRNSYLRIHPNPTGILVAPKKPMPRAGIEPATSTL